MLAHEIAHVVKRHQINALQKSMQNEALGAMDDYFGATSGIGGGVFTAALLGAGKKLYASGLDKEDEYEADRMAVVIAARAGYSPYGLGGVLQTLGGFSGKRSDFALMFGTHPTPISRIERLAKAMGTKLDTLPVQDDMYRPSRPCWQGSTSLPPNRCGAGKRAGRTLITIAPLTELAAREARLRKQGDGSDTVQGKMSPWPRMCRLIARKKRQISAEVDKVDSVLGESSEGARKVTNFSKLAHIEHGKFGRELAAGRAGASARRVWGTTRSKSHREHGRSGACRKMV